MSENHDPAIIRKLRAILALAEQGVGGEADNARQLYQEFLDRYEIDPSIVEDAPRTFRFKLSRTHVEIARRIVTSLDIEAYYYSKWPKLLVVTATRTTFDLFKQLFLRAVELKRQKRREVELAVRSFMAGYLDAAFPLKWDGLPCPKCGEPTYGLEGDRFVCSSCGHRGNALRKTYVNKDDYRDGAARSKPPLPAPAAE